MREGSLSPPALTLFLDIITKSLNCNAADRAEIDLLHPNEEDNKGDSAATVAIEQEEEHSQASSAGRQRDGDSTCSERVPCGHGMHECKGEV